jgi:hypothetical protein
LVLDGDLLPPRTASDAPPGETESAALTLVQRFNTSAASIRRDLERGDELDFERTRLYERAFARADQLQGRVVPRAVIPAITLKSPKFTRKLTTEWFARRVDDRYRRCLTSAKTQPSDPG